MKHSEPKNEQMPTKMYSRKQLITSVEKPLLKWKQTIASMKIEEITEKKKNDKTKRNK